MLVIDGLKRIINSAKVQTTAAAAFSAWMIYYGSDGTPAEKMPLKMALISAIGALVGIVLVAWAVEDYAAKKAQALAKPTTQLNVGVDKVENAAAPVPMPVPIEVPKPVPKPTVGDLLLVAINKLSERIDKLPVAPSLSPHPTESTPVMPVPQNQP